MLNLKSPSRKNILVVLAAAILFAGYEKDAHALQGGEDPALLPVLLDKRFGSKSRHQLGLTFSTAIASKFIEATGGQLTYTYSFTDLLGVELGVGGFIPRESSIMEQVRINFPETEPPLSDLYALQWTGMLSLMIVPIYGKMSFASEVDPSFDLYFIAGAGAAGLRRQTGPRPGVDKEFSSTVGLAFNAGLGFRFYVSKLVALRFEFRDYFYPDPGIPSNVMVPMNTEKPSGPTFNLHIQAGLQFAFGGEE